MAGIEAHAPGKLVIVGEYGVLAGGPGIAVAVDVTATARILVLPGGSSHLAIPHTGEEFPFRWIAGAPPRWEQASPGALGLPLEAVVEILYSRGILKRAGDLPPCRIELSTEAFHWTGRRGDRHKLGLGSSAAVVVALVGALLRFIGGAPVDHATQLALCFEAHRRLQGGVGSGIDVATTLAGGVIGAEFPAPLAVPKVTPLVWPRDLNSLAIWCGVSASTPAMLGRLRAWREQHGPLADGHLARLSGSAARVLTSWRAGDVSAIVAGIADFSQGLHRLDADAGIGIYSPEHLRLEDMSRTIGTVYKPSGAGGGDFGIAFSDSKDKLKRLRTTVEEAGFLCLEAPLCAPGLSVSGAGQARGALLRSTRAAT